MSDVSPAGSSRTPAQRSSAPRHAGQLALSLMVLAALTTITTVVYSGADRHLSLGHKVVVGNVGLSIATLFAFGAIYFFIRRFGVRRRRAVVVAAVLFLALFVIVSLFPTPI